MSPNKANQLVQTQLQKVLKGTRKSFFYVGVFSLFINVLMLVPSLYMLQVYDRVMSSRSLETLVFITLIVAVMFATMGVLQTIRSKILVRISNKIDMKLNSHLFDAIFYLARSAPGKITAQPISDLIKIRQFMTGQGVFAFLILLGFLYIFL